MSYKGIYLRGDSFEENNHNVAYCDNGVYITKQCMLSE